MQLRDYQIDHLERIERALESDRSVLAVSPTGTGKTVEFVELARRRAARGVLIVVPRVELIRQAHNKLELAGVPHGVIGSAWLPTMAPVQVCSIQTIVNRLRSLPPIGLIMPDEAHHSVAKTWQKLLGSQPAAQIVGWTATPQRLDGTGLGATYQAMVQSQTIPWFIERGHLLPSRVFAAPQGMPDVDGLPTSMGDFQTGALDAIMDRPELVGDSVALYEQRCSGQPALIFCTSVRAAHNATAAFRAEGYQWATVWGEMDKELGQGSRERAFKGLETGELHGLSSCGLIDEGVDIPRLRVVIDRAPSMSLGRVMQRWGRAMRPARNKDHWTLLDNAGNVIRRSGAVRHGMPETEREWSLTSRKRSQASSAPPVAQCPVCFALHRPAPVCPECGHDYRAAAAERDIRQVAAELEELKHLPPAPPKPPPDARRADLERYAHAKGYSPKWVDIQMQFRRKAAYIRSDGSEFMS